MIKFHGKQTIIWEHKDRDNDSWHETDYYAGESFDWIVIERMTLSGPLRKDQATHRWCVEDELGYVAYLWSYQDNKITEE